MFRPARPDRLLRPGSRSRRWGPPPPPATRRRPSATPTTRRSSTSSARSPSREVHRRTNAPRPRARRPRRRRGRQRRDHVPQPPRLHRRRRVALLQARRPRALPEHDVRRAADHRGVRAREAEGDRLRRGVRRARRARRGIGASASSPGRRPSRGRHADSCSRTSSRAATRRRRAAGPEAGRVVILTSGTTGTPKGAPRRQPRVARRRSPRCSTASRCARARRTMSPRRCSTRGASRTGCSAIGLSLDGRAAPRASTPRARLRATAQYRVPTRLVVVPVMLQRILELPAEIDRPLRHPRLRRHRGQRPALPGRARRRRSWTASATSSTTSTARPRWPGRRSPRPRTCAPRPAPRASPPRGTVVKLFDEDGGEVRPGETGRIFVGNEMRVRGLHRRRRQGEHRRPDVLRRRRPLRRGRAACSSTAATTR